MVQLQALLWELADIRSDMLQLAAGYRARRADAHPNQGPYIMAAVRVLDNILRRMQAHQSKKTSRLRPLSLAQRFTG